MAEPALPLVRLAGTAAREGRRVDHATPAGCGHLPPAEKPAAAAAATTGTFSPEEASR